MIDTMTNPSNPKVVICSTIMNVTPLEMMLWRNYGYRDGQEPVYKVRPPSPPVYAHGVPKNGVRNDFILIRVTFTVLCVPRETIKRVSCGLQWLAPKLNYFVSRQTKL